MYNANMRHVKVSFYARHNERTSLKNDIHLSATVSWKSRDNRGSSPFPWFPLFFSNSRYVVASTNDYSALRSQCEKLPEPETVIIARNEQ